MYYCPLLLDLLCDPQTTSSNDWYHALASLLISYLTRNIANVQTLDTYDTNIPLIDRHPISNPSMTPITSMNRGSMQHKHHASCHMESRSHLGSLTITPVHQNSTTCFNRAQAAPFCLFPPILGLGFTLLALPPSSVLLSSSFKLAALCRLFLFDTFGLVLVLGPWLPLRFEP